MKSDTKLYCLQALRAVAAWLVVADHALLEITNGQPNSSNTHIAWTLGSTGVSVFFVISGFIMVYICWEDFGSQAAVADFIRRRVTRLVPLYWVATVAALAYHRVSATHGAHDGWSELVYSLAFIPYAGDSGSWSPILPQGWTLSYEMMFYAIFAVGLSFRRRTGLPTIGMTLGALVIVGPLLPYDTLAYLASPILLWFLLGMGLAFLWRWRGFEEPDWLARSVGFLESMGDASYSTYLIHGFILTMLLRIWMLAAGPPSIWIVPVSLVIVTIAGWTVHMTVEIPILRIVSKLLKQRRNIASSLKARGAS